MAEPYIRTFEVDTGGCTEYCAVVGSTSNKVKLPAAAAAENGLGVARTTQSAGEFVEVQMTGEVYVHVGEAITTIGTPLTIEDSTGTFDIADTNNDPIYAIALETATADGDIIKALLTPGGRFGA